MTNKNYRSGRRFEYKIKKWLEKYGWFICRTAGSHSAFDLIAFRDGYFYPMQLKYGSNITKKELKKLHELSEKLQITICVIHGQRRKKPEIIEIDGNDEYKLTENWFEEIRG